MRLEYNLVGCRSDMGNFKLCFGQVSGLTFTVLTKFKSDQYQVEPTIRFDPDTTICGTKCSKLPTELSESIRVKLKYSTNESPISGLGFSALFAFTNHQKPTPPSHFNSSFLFFSLILFQVPREREIEKDFRLCTSNPFSSSSAQILLYKSATSKTQKKCLTLYSKQRKLCP